jgi:hypothetical protein
LKVIAPQAKTLKSTEEAETSEICDEMKSKKKKSSTRRAKVKVVVLEKEMGSGRSNRARDGNMY